MVFANSYTKILVDKFPGFKESASLSSEIEFWSTEDGPLSACAVFSALVSYVIDELIPSSPVITAEEIDLYNYLEILRRKYSKHPGASEEGQFDEALCTCFLESFMNRAGNQIEIFSRFIPYLGTKCKEFCKAWDKFTGVRSPGLWDDEEWGKVNN